MWVPCYEPVRTNLWVPCMSTFLYHDSVPTPPPTTVRENPANQQNQPYPLLLRVLPLAVSGSLEALLYLCMPKRSSEDLVLFAVLCFMVGTVLVEAYEWATTMIFADKLSGRAAKITPHFRANASG